MLNSIQNDLNQKQIEAITSIDGYVRVIAGAGSGKTKALTHRYSYLVGEAGIPPRNILCVTFTNKAACEMKRRVKGL
ncbi:MAG TPA: UvrD-helicase domain-containing protein, partial [Oscillospiraceae bacterium]|nr:UvrD-helicase domain-containing protein [Oscillospiraceae bacterium]